MYIHIGQDMLVPRSQIIGVFDLDNTTYSKHTRTFLSRAEKQGLVVNVSEDIPKSFVLCEGDGDVRVFVSQIASSTIFKRSESGLQELY